MPISTHDRRWWILAMLCLVVLIVVIDNTIVNVALPVISRDLHASNSSLQWIVDAYSLPFAGLLLREVACPIALVESESCRLR